jgi:hypothetical protein
LILSKKTERKSLTFKAEEMKCREDWSSKISLSLQRNEIKKGKEM